MSPVVHGADDWQQRLQKAWGGASADVRDKKELNTLYELIVNWNRRCDAESTGAVAYKYWKESFGEDVKKADRAGLPPPAAITDAMLLAKLDETAARLQADFGRLDVVYGEVYRVGRQAAPAPGPSAAARWPTSPRRARSASNRSLARKKFLGHGGQTSTQVVPLTNPPKLVDAVAAGRKRPRGQPALRRPGRAAVQQGQDEADLLPRQGRTA